MVCLYIYEVRRGDTLTAIARRAGVTVSQITALNRLPSPALVPGQALLIPSTRYVVQPGDSLWEIARKSGVQLSDLQRANPGLGTTLQPGQVVQIPPPDPYPAEVIGYLPVLDPGVTAEDVAAWGRVLTFVAVFAYRVDSRGNLTTIDDAAAIQAARRAGASPLMSIANLGEGGRFSPEIAQSILTDPGARERVLDSVMATVEEKGYDGVDADIENIPRPMREPYVAFLRLFKERLGRRLLNVAVSPQVDEEFEYGRGHDYAGIGRVADRVYIMNYEYHWAGGPPGPPAPLPQIRRVLEYATSLMPRQKVLNGISVTAYDWPLPDTPERRGLGISSTAALALAVRTQSPIQYDEEAETPWFRYTEDGQSHEVWFEDARSLMAKLRLARELGLGGTGIWHLGLRLPPLERLLAYLFDVRKAGQG